jgi:hypothetical protein
LFCFRAEDVRADSESRRRDSWEISDSRYKRVLLVVLRGSWVPGVVLVQGCPSAGFGSVALLQKASGGALTLMHIGSRCGITSRSSKS